ncbi:hypothetical protein AB0O67_00660 [Streptomyces sp. NPDC086077]|uniref:hypothetical protein n=1 Tax=Streptomyces sp. NPDC086077 TaxID=3154862 RepID=UPI0034389E78
MPRTTLFTAMQQLLPTGGATGAGRHRGRRAHEHPTLLGQPGSGRHRRVREAALSARD